MTHTYTHGKFSTASRKNAGAVVSGNSVYVTEEAFKEYANYRCFWIFSNDEGEGNTATTVSETSNVSYTRYVSTQASNLNVRSGAGMSYSVLTTITKGTEVTVTNVSGNWSYITSPTSRLGINCISKLNSSNKHNNIYYKLCIYS